MDHPFDYSGEPTFGDKELVTEQRIYRQADEDRMYADFEAQLAQKQKEEALRKEEKRKKKKERKQKEKEKRKKKKERKHKKEKHKSKKRKRHESSESSSESSESSDSSSSDEETEKKLQQLGNEYEDDSDIKRAQRAQQLSLDKNQSVDVDKRGFMKPDDTNSAPSEPPLQREEWMLAPPKRLLGETSKKEEAPKEKEGPKVSAKELNPELNPQSALSQTAPATPSYLVGDGGKSWRERALRRQMERERAAASGVSTDSRDSRSNRDNRDNRDSRDSRDIRDSRSETRDYHESRTHTDSSSSYRRGWRKRDVTTASSSEGGREQKETVMPAPTSTAPQPAPALTQAEIEELSQLDPNKLAAQIMKAELRGDNETVQQLKNKLERYEKFMKGEMEQGGGDSKTVIISDIDSQGRSRSATIGKLIESRPDDDPSASRRKRRKVEGYTDGERTRYFADDDISLQELVEREKRGGGVDMDAAFAENLMRNRHFKLNTLEADNLDVDDIDYDMWESRENKMSKEKLMQRQRQKAIWDHKRVEQIIEQCYYCYMNKKIPRHLIIALGEHTYLMLPDRPLVDFHCYIVPVEHELSLTTMDETIWKEVELFMISLTKMFQANGYAAVFYETILNYKQKRHTIIECVPLPKDDAFNAPLYFKKAILESESEWSQHRKLIDTSGKGVRRCIPPNMPYFYVQFGLHNGYAHVIENDRKFSRFFGREVIAGILGLDADQYIFKPKKKTEAEERQLAQKFLSMFSPYDWTLQLDG